MEKHMAMCPYCGAGCKMNLVVENGRSSMRKASRYHE